MNTDSQWSKQEACSVHVRATQVWLAVLANEFDVRRVLHGQMDLAAVTYICVIHEAMNGCKNLKP